MSFLTTRPRSDSSASNYTHEPTYPEGYGGSASNYTHESTYRDGYGSHPTGHEISTAYQTHQPSRTGRPEPQEMDSNPRYGMTSGQSQHTQRPNRDPTSPPRRQDFRSSISTSTTSDYSVPHLGSQTFMGRIRGGTPAESTLDPNYQVQSHPTDFFKPGRVFSTLWNESQGSTPSNRTAVSAGPVFYGRYREPIYSHIRRMVVYKTNGHCSWCFPIYTYNRQGVGKPDVIVQDHAIIHNQGAYPQLGPREPRMTKSPLEFEPFTPDQALDPMSRLNFGKIYTVEHNVKVRKVGRISHTSMATFRNYARSSMLRE
ncbi:hypothetical protein BDW42DRAFT_169689 [Aspergillus taichungensis]|uniref:DUF6590 domain-containing protein n=1 Tax=Aspergillus taichungensis TaxID=482145 RepID=A0A2J5HUD8_9EURO|nr:hypothetical protein BDW42DRAFT_169689 [Aspergillus taichungensis]